MKFTKLEPLNQRINEFIKKYDLNKITEKSNIKRVVDEKFNDKNNTVDRLYDESNETCSQVFIKCEGSRIYANVFITESDTPEYTTVSVVE